MKKKSTTPDNDELSRFKPASENFEFREFPFYWIMRLGSRYTHKMEKSLKAVDMNITNWRVGMILREHGALSITEISTHAVARLPTITKAVYKMQEKNLVVIKPQKDDGRVSVVTITPRGLEVIDTVIASTEKIFGLAFDGLSPNDMQNLNQHLQTIFSNLDDD